MGILEDTPSVVRLYMEETVLARVMWKEECYLSFAMKRIVCGKHMVSKKGDEKTDI